MSSSETEVKKMPKHAEIQRSYAITPNERAAWDKRVEELKQIIKEDKKNRDDRSRSP